MRYTQLTREERFTLATLRRQAPPLSQAEIARIMGRHPSTISRELRRNSARHDGAYRPSKAQERTNGRRSRSRRNSHFGQRQWRVVERLLQRKWSPEQISLRLRRDGKLSISHETIYTHIYADKLEGGDLHLCRRQAFKRRKRRGTYEKRGRVLGKRHITERPAIVETRTEFGHWELDTIIGSGSQDCMLSLVERASGLTLLGKLRNRSAAELNRRLVAFIRRRPEWFKTITPDNGTEFHSYQAIERATGVVFYFATPYHSWERGTNENTNGLVRQYVPKRTSMRRLTQRDCNRIAHELNHRPRKRYDALTPAERVAQLLAD